MATTIGKSGSVMMDDPESITRFRLIALRSALKLQQAGFKVHRSVNARKIAKALTGLRTNDLDALILAVEMLIDEQTRKVEFIVDEQSEPDGPHGPTGNEGHG